jgi:hypothetical protein
MREVTPTIISEEPSDELSMTSLMKKSNDCLRYTCGGALMDQWPAYTPQMAKNSSGFRIEQLAEHVLDIDVGRRFRVDGGGA